MLEACVCVCTCELYVAHTQMRDRDKETESTRGRHVVTATGVEGSDCNKRVSACVCLCLHNANKAGIICASALQLCVTVRSKPVVVNQPVLLAFLSCRCVCQQACRVFPLHNSTILQAKAIFLLLKEWALKWSSHTTRERPAKHIEHS